ncbi:MAG: hypothetical protein ACJ71Q_13855 [Terriglobales bacterium]
MRFASLLLVLTLGSPGMITHPQAQSACCSITAVDQSTGSATAKVNTTGQTFQFRPANVTQVRMLKVGKSVYANFSTRQVSLDGRTNFGTITTSSIAPQAATAGGAITVPGTSPAGVSPCANPQQQSGGSGSSPATRVLACVHVVDGLTLQPRPGLKIEAVAHIACMSSVPDCKGDFTTPLIGNTDDNGRATLGSGPITRTCQNSQHQLVTAMCSVSQVQVTGVDKKDEWGWEVDPIPGLPVTGTVENGGTLNLSGVTPKPMRRDLLDPQYGGSPQGNTSELLGWKGLANSIGTILLVPDMDSINVETPTNTLVSMRKVAGPLLRQGFDVYIGNYGDGARPLRQFDSEIANWINQARSVSGRKVHIMGIGVGGVLVRQALVDVSTLSTSLSAWYSLDAPHKGLNFGSGEDSRVVFACANYNQNVWADYLGPHPSRSTSELDFNTPSCTCGVSSTDYQIGEDPSKWHCTSNSQAHDGYVSSLGWPSANIPHFAVAYGDVYTHALMGDKDNLIDVTFSLSINCPYNSKRLKRWKRDCVAGSRYLTVGDVNHQIRSDLFGKGGTAFGGGVCGNMEIKLAYQPAFVNIDSALAANIEPVEMQDRGNCRYDYSGPLDSSTVTHWTDWAGNASNWDHRVLSDYLACKLVSWVDSVQHVPSPRSCSSAPKVTSNF